MNRAARRRIARATPVTGAHEPTHPDCVYRFFERREYAEALLAGEVWLGSLEGYRRDEHPERGDSGEATHRYTSGTIHGDSTEPDLQLIATRLGIGLTNSKDVLISGATNNSRISDAWMLCACLDHAPQKMNEFGRYCVRIKRLDEFAHHVGAAVSAECELSQFAHGRVLYKSREYTGVDPLPGPIGFTKPPQYRYQNEYRFMYIPRDPGICAGRVFQCAAVRPLVELVHMP